MWLGLTARLSSFTFSTKHRQVKKFQDTFILKSGGGCTAIKQGESLITVRLKFI